MPFQHGFAAAACPVKDRTDIAEARNAGSALQSRNAPEKDEPKSGEPILGLLHRFIHQAKKVTNKLLLTLK